MFFIPYGIKLGSGVTVRNYIARSMVPVFIGNMIAGAFFLAGSYAFCYGASLILFPGFGIPYLTESLTKTNCSLKLGDEGFSVPCSSHWCSSPNH